MSSDPLPSFPYGAVYFRKSNPPREDWARDYRTAAQDGMNAFRHWFLWSAIEVAPGVYDWDDYDRQLDLAAEHGLNGMVLTGLTQLERPRRGYLRRLQEVQALCKANGVEIIDTFRSPFNPGNGVSAEKIDFRAFDADRLGRHGLNLAFPVLPLQVPPGPVAPRAQSRSPWTGCYSRAVAGPRAVECRTLRGSRQRPRPA